MLLPTHKHPHITKGSATALPCFFASARHPCSGQPRAIRRSCLCVAPRRFSKLCAACPCSRLANHNRRNRSRWMRCRKSSAARRRRHRRRREHESERSVLCKMQEAGGRAERGSGAGRRVAHCRCWRARAAPPLPRLLPNSTSNIHSASARDAACANCRWLARLFHWLSEQRRPQPAAAVALTGARRLLLFFPFTSRFYRFGVNYLILPAIAFGSLPPVREGATATG